MSDLYVFDGQNGFDSTKYIFLSVEFSDGGKTYYYRTEDENTKCGCFYCLKIFEPKEIEEYIEDDNELDRYGTAICPYCGIDSVISESSGYPITEDFFEKNVSLLVLNYVARKAGGD